jgi:putative addiction module component (TIGR02574 family)
MILEKLPEVEALSAEEKQLLAEEIWDDLSRMRDPFPITEEQLQILEDRVAEYRAHPERVKSWDDVKRNLSERFGNRDA